jgi:hypothetical protein
MVAKTVAAVPISPPAPRAMLEDVGPAGEREPSRAKLAVRDPDGRLVLREDRRGSGVISVAS